MVPRLWQSVALFQLSGKREHAGPRRAFADIHRNGFAVAATCGLIVAQLTTLLQNIAARGGVIVNYPLDICQQRSKILLVR